LQGCHIPLSCLPKPSFADMVCCVGDMSLVMLATRRHSMQARVSKGHAYDL